MKTTAPFWVAALAVTTAIFGVHDRAVHGQSLPGTATDAGLLLPVGTDPGDAASAERERTEAEPRLRVALQAGHWKAAEAPDELAGLRSNGTRGGGKAEWEVTLEIATLTAPLLEAVGIEVDILPTTVPPGYRADLFVAIHADGHASTTATGFTVGAPRRDATGQGERFAEILAHAYREATGLRRREVTRRMQGYYAFNSRRYEHAIHPTTVAVILETGFLTSPSDRQIIVSQPERSAQGIAQAVLRFLEIEAPTAPPTTVAR